MEKTPNQVNLDIQKPIESDLTINYVDLLKDVVNGIAELCFIKTFDPHIIAKTKLEDIKINAHTMYVYSERIRKMEEDNYSSSLIIYYLKNIIPWFAMELEYVASCLQMFINKTLSKPEYYCKVMRMDNCSFWHSGTGTLSRPLSPSYDVCTLNKAHQVLFDLDFYFNIIKSDHISSALTNLEAFIGKIFGTLLVLPPFLVDVQKPCQDCIIDETYDYNLAKMKQYNCSHLFEIVDTIENDGLITFSDNGVEQNENNSHLSESHKIGNDITNNPHLGITVIKPTDSLKEEQAKQFYAKLNICSNNHNINNEFDKDINNKLIRKAEYLEHFIKTRQMKNYQDWVDAREALFDQELLNNQTLLLFTKPLFGLTSHELIKNQQLVMEQQLLNIKEAEENFIRNTMAHTNAPEIIAARARKIYNTDTLIKILEGNQDIDNDETNLQEQDVNVPGSLTNIIHNMAKKDPVEAIQDAKNRAITQYGLIINREILELRRKITTVTETLKRAINPSIPGIRIFRMAFKIFRATIAEFLFHQSIANTQSSIMPPANIMLFSNLTNKIETKIIGKISEKIKYFSMGPIYKDADSDDFLPLRKGFTLHTLWTAKDIPACSKLSFKEFCEMDDLRSRIRKSGQIFNLKNIIKVMLEDNSLFYKKLPDYVNNTSKYINELYEGNLRKIRSAVVITLAYNILYDLHNRLRLRSCNSERLIRCGMNGKECFLLKPGLYIGRVESEFNLVYIDKKSNKLTSSSSRDLIQLCTTYLLQASQ